MSTPTTNTSLQSLDELDRQIKQAEMIRQYLQVTNIDRNAPPTKYLTESESCPPTTTGAILPLSSVDINELRRDLKLAEERVERLRQEVKELQSKRSEPFLKVPLPPPPPYVPSNTNSDYSNHNLAVPTNRAILERSTSPLVQELLSSQQQQQQQQQWQISNNGISSSRLLSAFNPVHHSSTIPVDLSKDHRHRQFLLTMHEHREQLLVYLDSLKQALNSLDRLASLEPTRNEIQLTNIKLDTIQQKSRQLRALKSGRSSQQSPFIECRIRQLEHDLVYMLSEHQKDVQAKLELNEQRSLMLLKIMQVTDELTTVDQQIQQLLSNTTPTSDIRRNSSPLSNEINQIQASSSLRATNPTNNLDGRRVSFREPSDNNPLTKLPNAYYHQY